MSSIAGCTRRDEMLRQKVRDHFIGKFQNPQLQQTLQETFFSAEYPSENLKEQNLKIRKKSSEFEKNFNAKQRSVQQAAMSGGDADRMYSSTCSPYLGGDCCRIRHNDDSFKHLETKSKSIASALTSNAMYARNYQTTSIANYTGNHSYHENDSSLSDGGGNGSDSGKSQKSSKTVVSRKGSHDLRKLVISQCRLHEVIDETINGICNPEDETSMANKECMQEFSAQHNLTVSPCKGCTDRLRAVQSQKDVTTEIGQGDFLDCRNTNTLTISVDDVVNSRVINPMIQKLHRMYLNNLKEEMSLMEDLERLPKKVNEVYKSILFKKSD